LQRSSKRTLGYFGPQRFEKIGGGEQKTDVIAINPQYFKHSSIEKVLSTLVHEMVHQWHEHYGISPPRSGYHKREWAKKMESIGLMPSQTGQPGGKKTGQSVSHYIIPCGAFEQACAGLLSGGFRLVWGEIVWKGESNRGKFTCPACDANAWGKPTLKLICGDCRIPMVAK
jgi:predicted SprT family Zn-dependent metalloprotease